MISYDADALMQDALNNCKDKLDAEADRRITSAFYKRLGELSDADVKKHGTRKCHPDRDVYLYKGEEVITVYRPVFEWDEERTRLNVSVTFMEK